MRVKILIALLMTLVTLSMFATSTRTSAYFLRLRWLLSHHRQVNGWSSTA
jgi:hypothetical protein